ncbi:tryptophan--tRNA ligase [Vaginisenegalia massiliensis]|uniref:tryptophan--tRNA ligase n=1 Tax=Vaginisenegalia massiliensis TaxID=2058294 RepID=UPI000F53767D|nr:tryptophan--tRNA ligase [Vaginisenegalia massiliensis]
MEKVMLTGDRPTGRLHLGHYVGSLKNRVQLQNSGEFDQVFIMIADQQALTDNADNPQKIRDHVAEVAMDYLAVGVDPSKATVFLQSDIPEIAELNMYFQNLVTVSRVQRNPTVKAEIQQKGFGESVPVGFFVYSISQAADILAFRGTHVPAGEDQKPLIEQANEIVATFGRYYDPNLFQPIELVLPPKGMERLVGIDGRGKMSKSLNNGIYLADDEDIIQKKVMKMYTDPNHINVADPGQVEGNVVFTYLDIFCPDKELVASLKAQYQAGGLGDVKLKRLLNDVLQEELRPIRQRRLEFAKDPAQVMKMLEEGGRRARQTAAVTLSQAKTSMGINYFNR